jgi:hypothetical protein
MWRALARMITKPMIELVSRRAFRVRTAAALDEEESAP